MMAQHNNKFYICADAGILYLFKKVIIVGVAG